MATRKYYPAECILDLLAASGAQYRDSIMAECFTQCTFDEFLTGSSSLQRNAVIFALVELCNAGLVEMTPNEDGEPGYWDLTDYGYECMAGQLWVVHYDFEQDAATAKPNRKYLTRDLKQAQKAYDAFLGLPEVFTVYGPRPR